MKKQKKKKGWMRLRHKVVRNLAYGLIGIYVRLSYGVKVRKFKEQ